ncbi:MAG: VWA domain-containing protein [Fibrobacterota bacterium]|nr:VWA domain-containing protein [Fibrobacterota bacterium]QQS06453.1 MAG: VWA domain-containing protein [Fibrobacterota bacterium]
MNIFPLVISSLSLAGQPRIETRVEPLPPESLSQSSDRKAATDPWAGMPLKETRVKAKVNGIVGRVEVTQRFENHNSQAIEAVYVFPLPANAAVNEYSFRMGSREVRGVVKTREAARATYQEARSQGKTAALLEQERPNLFTQSVANIPAGQSIEVRIQYDVELTSDSGRYTFVFPTVVGPRFCPAGKVADESALKPPILASGEPNPHRIQLELDLDAGLPVHNLRSVFHKVAQTTSEHAVHISTDPDDDVPNKDFRLEWSVGQARPEVALVLDRQKKGGHFLLMIEPPAVPDSSQIVPREVVLLLDQSGSMNGQPLSAVQQAARKLVERLRPVDRIQIVSFSDFPQWFADTSLPVTKETRRRALSWIDGLRSAGGTEMKAGLLAALDAPPRGDLQRLVCLMTDGYIGNESEILQAIHDRVGDRVRVHVFGVGSSVNQHMIEGGAKAGRGTAFVVPIGKDPTEIVDKFWSKLQSPLLTGIRLDWGDLPVADVEPEALEDLYAGYPIHLSGRFKSAAKGTLTVTGRTGTKKVTYKIPVDLSQPDATHPAVGGLWARSRIGRLTLPWAGDHKEDVTKLALEYHLMSPFTSFVAVLDSVTVKDGKSIRIDVPLELPLGVTESAVPYGTTKASYAANQMPKPSSAPPPPPPPMVAGSSGSRMELGAGKIDGFLDNPNTVYMLTEDVSTAPEVAPERDLSNLIEKHACGDAILRIDTIDIQKGGAVRVSQLRQALQKQRAALESAAKSHHWPTMDLVLEIDVSGNVTLAKLVMLDGSLLAGQYDLQRIFSSLRLGSLDDDPVTLRVRMGFDVAPCRPLPSIEEK